MKDTADCISWSYRNIRMVFNSTLIHFLLSPAPAEEYMKDAEDYINIELDSSQNRLFRLDIVLTAAAFSMEIFHVMGGASVKYFLS